MLLAAPRLCWIPDPCENAARRDGADPSGVGVMDRLEHWIDARPWRFKLVLSVQTAALLGTVLVAVRF